MSQFAAERETYAYRPYEAGDAEGFLDLYRSVWGRERTTEWFRWRFEENPYTEAVPMVVAERDGELVGAEPCLAMRVSGGGTGALALQPADWIVHPDHRRRGVFSGMTESLLDRYADRAALFFNFPSEALVPGVEKFGWTVGPGPVDHYRVHDPGALLGEEGRGGRLGRLAAPFARGYARARTRLARTDPEVSVERRETVPAELLADLDAGVPGSVHVVHDEAFYRWRFANPAWATTTYLARRGGETVAAAVAVRETVGGVARTNLLAVAPRDGSADAAALRALVAAVVTDAADDDAVRVAGDAIPARVLRSFGFVAGDAFPLSTAARRCRLAVRTPDGRRLDGCDPTDFGAWSLSMADRDVA
ncbi:GNAT family N-acetyltransferase [Halosegnis marinus]|uniref:GNAT family N-acetyltransferase n=1 Tax=Halosegnis marinus TaxID=3034023 RepID=A0ABD5ZMU2_9EURY|nr:GNAT family N-acetyltransferase [Halosegnis sp. DT85]